MPAIVRRTSTKVVDGRVTRKSRTNWSSVDGCVIRNYPAGRGYRHVVSPKQLREFLEIIPHWAKHSYRLESVALVGAKQDSFGYFTSFQHAKVSMIALCAWPKNLWLELSPGFFHNHREIFEQLGVAYKFRIDRVICEFTVAQARAFMLLNVFMHELGHHRDWLRRRGHPLPGKEEVAEDFARRYWDMLHPLYCERFGDPLSKVRKEDEDEIIIPRWTRVI